METVDIKTVVKLRKFIPALQLKTMVENLGGEEGEFFAEKLNAIAFLIKCMPKTHETDGQERDAVAVLHYFSGGSDWYITEKDMESVQHQAYGLASVGCGYPEMGYISLVELCSRPSVELDLHWEPKPLKEIE